MVLPALGYLMWITQAQKWTTPTTDKGTTPVTYRATGHNDHHASIHPRSAEMTTNDW
ncbi:MAG: hypothetical protein QOI01_595 [Mycobacterium sp.]|jgi:hypothetical protein|nr:hypothetical protein [Mycobacterium sp.]